MTPTTPKPPTLAERIDNIARRSMGRDISHPVAADLLAQIAGEVAALEAENARLRANEAAFCSCGDACNRNGSRCPVCASADAARIAAMDETAESLRMEEPE